MPNPEGEGKLKGFEALVVDYQAEKKCSRGEAIREVARSHPDAHEKFVEEQKARGAK